MTNFSSSSKAAGKDRTGEPQPPANPPAKHPAKPITGKDFGQEGTNKIQAAPKPDGAPPEQLGVTPYIEKSPYTRG